MVRYIDWMLCGCSKKNYAKFTKIIFIFISCMLTTNKVTKELLYVHKKFFLIILYFMIYFFFFCVNPINIMWIHC